MSINHLVNPNIKPRLDLYVNSVTSDTPIVSDEKTYWVTAPAIYSGSTHFVLTKTNPVEITEIPSDSLAGDSVKFKGSGIAQITNFPNLATLSFDINTKGLNYSCLDIRYVSADIQNKNQVIQGGYPVAAKLYHKLTSFQPLGNGLRLVFELPVVDDGGSYNDLAAGFTFEVIVGTTL